MTKLVKESGAIDFGIYEHPIDEVNYKDYRLETPMGIPVPRTVRSALAKQFHFLGIIGPELVIGMAVIDLKYMGSGFAYVYDRRTRRMTETRKLVRGGGGAIIEPYPDCGRSAFESPALAIEAAGGHVSARGEGFELSLKLGLGECRPLRICTRAGYRGWAYTQKTAPVPVEGSVSIHGERVELGSPDYMALTDWTCGYMRRETFWNWASTATTLEDGRALGLNLSCGVNETSFTENAFWLGPDMTKVDLVSFELDGDNLMRPWRITSRDGKVDLTFQPQAERGEKIAAVLISSRFSQLFGTFDGRLRRDDGETIELKDCPGFAEDHYAKW